MNKRAFTLIELLVVIAIVGIISGLILVNMNGATNAAKDGRRKMDIDTIRRALLMYSIQNGNTYPIQSTQCNIGNNCSVLTTAISSYLPTTPTDPSGIYYTYQSSGTDCTITANLSSGLIYKYSCLTGYNTASPFNCGDSVTFTYNGSSVTYGTTTSQAGKCFMDRNLGAGRVATAYNDSAAYGDLFQWGRGIDGHQLRTAGATTTLSSTDIPGHADYIYGMGSPYDWRSSQNDNLWQGANGINNPCPTGWRIPTITEWHDEIIAGSWTNYNNAYASPLKLTAAGYRYMNSLFVYVDSFGMYWSSTKDGSLPYSRTCNLIFTNSSADASISSDGYRVNALSVRCIKD